MEKEEILTEILTVHLPETTNSNNENVAYRRLWQAVLCRALNDAIDKSGLKQHQARAWLTGYGARFQEVCFSAGYDSHYVLRQAKALENEGWPNHRKEPHLKAA